MRLQTNSALSVSGFHPRERLGISGRGKAKWLGKPEQTLSE